MRRWMRLSSSLSASARRTADRHPVVVQGGVSVAFGDGAAQRLQGADVAAHEFARRDEQALVEKIHQRIHEQQRSEDRRGHHQADHPYQTLQRVDALFVEAVDGRAVTDGRTAVVANGARHDQVRVAHEPGPMPNLGFRIGPRGRCLGQRRVIAGGAGRLHVTTRSPCVSYRRMIRKPSAVSRASSWSSRRLRSAVGAATYSVEQSRVMGRLLIDPVRELSVHLSHAEAQCGQRAQGREHEPGGDQAQEERAPGVVEARRRSVVALAAFAWSEC